jgi:hypothetical protein
MSYSLSLLMSKVFLVFEYKIVDRLGLVPHRFRTIQIKTAPKPHPQSKFFTWILSCRKLMPSSSHPHLKRTRFHRPLILTAQAEAEVLEAEVSEVLVASLLKM